MAITINSWRLKWYPRAVLFGLFLAYVIALANGKGPLTVTGRLGGDFPAFYGAGRIIAHGDWGRLYDPEVQRQVQKDILPTGQGYLAFSYPPYVALLYMPFSLLDYRLSFAIYTIIMAGALLLCLQLVRPMVKIVDDHFLPAFTLALTFYPLLRSIAGGQNTSLTLLIMAGVWRTVEDGNDYLGGIILGLLFLKPQFALPLIAVFALSGRLKVCAGAVLTGLLLYLAGAWLQGPEWPMDWLRFAQWFSAVDSGVNKQNAVSWLGFFKALPMPGKMADIAGWAFIGMTCIALSWAWLNTNRKTDMGGKIGLASIALVMISPHLMYYDLGLVLFTVIALLPRMGKNSIFILLLVWFSGFSQVFANLLGFSPLFFLALFLLCLSFYVLLPHTPLLRRTRAYTP